MDTEEEKEEVGTWGGRGRGRKHGEEGEQEKKDRREMGKRMSKQKRRMGKRQSKWMRRIGKRRYLHSH